MAHLQRALAHYGVESLERTEALEHAGYRLFLARRRAGTTRESVRGILASRLERGEPLDDAYRAVLDRLETALAPREPALAELAREVRWRCCDAPALAAAREATYEEMAGHLAALGEAGDAAEREAHLAALVDCPQPLAPLLGRVSGDAGPLVEAMTRRYYRIRPLEGTRETLLDGVPFVLSSYERDGRRHHVAATLGDPDELPAALRALAAHARTIPAGEPVLADVYALRARARRPRRAARRGGAPGRGRARRVRALHRGGASTCAPMRATATADSPRTRPSAACIR